MQKRRKEYLLIDFDFVLSLVFLKDRDVFINVVGGMQIREPAVDLPLALSIASSFFNKPIDKDLVAFGELGLTGEIRSVHYTEMRIKEAERFGFKKVLVPANTEVEGKNIIKVKNIKEALSLLF